MKLTLQGVLKNKYLLYAVSALAVINVLGYLSIGSMECLGVFALTALVCQQYQKNMTICLLAAIFPANVVFGCGRIKENFTEGASEDGGAATTSTNPQAQQVAATVAQCCTDPRDGTFKADLAGEILTACDQEDAATYCAAAPAVVGGGAPEAN